MSKNIDVHKVKDIKDLNAYLSKIDKEGLTILYKNALVKIEIGKDTFYLVLDNALYSESSNILLLLVNNEIIEEDILKEKLTAKKINYNEIVLNKDEYELEQQLIIIRNKKTLLEKLTDNRIEETNTCTYYPNVEGNVDIGYFLDEECKKMKIKGVIAFNDILYLMADKPNMSKKEIAKVLLNLDVTTLINEGEEIQVTEDVKEYKKEK